MNSDLKKVLRSTKGSIVCIKLSPDDFKSRSVLKQISKQKTLKLVKEGTQICFARKRNSFLHGMGSVIDIAGTGRAIPRRGLSGMEADTRAIASDWKAVGRDFRVVLNAHPIPEAANE